MNIADLTAKIKVVLEKEDLGKLSEGLENVKKKIQELNKKLQDLSEEQKEAADQTEKISEKTEEAADQTEKQADSTEKLAEKTKKATSELHGFAGLLSRIVEFMKQLLVVGAASGVVLERMYEKAGRLGASLRLISTDFSLSPQALQQWQMLAEQAGLSFDTMDRMLSVATDMKRLAVQNPKFLPDALNIAGIRPANYKDPESLLKAILQTSLRFKNEQKRMAWLSAAGFTDAAAANLIAKQFAKGEKFDSAFFISDENVEKLKDVNVAIDKIDRLSESVKNNFLATISGDFVSQINSICEYIIRSVHAVEDFITRHGGFKKVLADLGGLTAQTSKIFNAFASMSKFVMEFGLFSSAVLGFGVVLGGVLKISEGLIEKFTKGLELAGSLKELIAGFVSIKVGEAIEAGKITGEYVGEATDLKNKLASSAGVYAEPSQVAKGIRSILTWLNDVYSKVKSTLFSVLSNAIFKGVDYFIDSLLRLWASMNMPFSEKARDLLFERAMQTPKGERSDYQKSLISQYETWAEQDAANKYYIKNFTPNPIRRLIGSEEAKDAERRMLRANTMFRDVMDLLQGGLTSEEIPVLAATMNMMNRLGTQKDMRPEYRDRIVELQQTFNLKSDDNISTTVEKIRNASKNGAADALNLQYASGIGG